MSGISVSGIGSGLDIDGIVTQLMQVESQRLTRYETRRDEFDAELSAYGKLKSAMSSFQSSMSSLSDLSKFRVFSATSSDEELFTASADEDAAAGSYRIDVQQLAQYQKIRTADAMNADDVGSGTLTLTLGDTSFDLTVEAGTSLDELAEALNGAAADAGVEVGATVIDGKYLVLTGTESGAENAFSVAVSGDATGDLAALAYDPGATDNAMVTVQAAQDAIMQIDGITITRADNTIDDAVDGLTFNLKGVTDGSETLTVARDDGAITDSVQSFVDAYNTMMATIDGYHSEDGALEGDNTLLSVESALRSLLNREVDGGASFSSLSELGITTGEDGTLSLDSSALSDALDESFSAVANLFASEDGGIAVLMEDLVGSYLGDNGLIEAREEGIQARIDSMDDTIAGEEYRLERVEARYRAQYASLDTLLAQMQSTSDYLTQQLASLG